MKPVALAIALFTGLVLALLLGEGLFGFVLFALAGLLGGWLAAILPPGSERVYWAFVLVTLVLFLVSVLVFSLHELIVIFPLVFTVGYFAARLALRVTGRRAARPS